MTICLIGKVVKACRTVTIGCAKTGLFPNVDNLVMVCGRKAGICQKGAEFCLRWVFLLSAIHNFLLFNASVTAVCWSVVWQKTEVNCVRKTDGSGIVLTIAYTNEIPPSAPNCIQLYNIIFKRFVSVLYTSRLDSDFWKKNWSHLFHKIIPLNIIQIVTVVKVIIKNFWAEGKNSHRWSTCQYIVFCYASKPDNFTSQKVNNKEKLWRLQCCPGNSAQATVCR